MGSVALGSRPNPPSVTRPEVLDQKVKPWSASDSFCALPGGYQTRLSGNRPKLSTALTESHALLSHHGSGAVGSARRRNASTASVSDGDDSTTPKYLPAAELRRRPQTVALTDPHPKGFPPPSDMTMSSSSCHNS